MIITFWIVFAFVILCGAFVSYAVTNRGPFYASLFFAFLMGLGKFLLALMVR